MPDSNWWNALQLAALGPAFIPAAVAGGYGLVRLPENPMMYVSPTGAIYQAMNSTGQAGYQLVGEVKNGVTNFFNNATSAFFGGAGLSAPVVVFGGAVLLYLILKRR